MGSFGQKRSKEKSYTDGGVDLAPAKQCLQQMPGIQGRGAKPGGPSMDFGEGRCSTDFSGPVQHVPLFSCFLRVFVSGGGGRPPLKINSTNATGFSHGHWRSSK